MSASATVADDGYALYRRVLDRAEIDTAAAMLDRLAESAGARARDGAVYGIRRLIEDPDVKRFVSSGPMRALARSVLGDGARPVKATLFDKRGGANWQVGWHQDVVIALAVRRDVPGFRNWTVKGGVPHAEPPLAILERMVALRLHLDDCGPDNGPLQVVPGSHALGRLGDARIDAQAANGPVETCVAAAGDVLALRPLLLHRSSRAASPSCRRVLHVEYAAADLPGGLEWAAGPHS